MDLIPRKFYLDDIFDDFLTTKKEQTMKCDIYEKDGNYCIEMDLPGYDKEDIKKLNKIERAVIMISIDRPYFFIKR